MLLQTTDPIGLSQNKSSLASSGGPLGNTEEGDKYNYNHQSIPNCYDGALGSNCLQSTHTTLALSQQMSGME